MGVQAGKLLSLFPTSIIQYSQNELTWKHSITPTPLSSRYEIKLHYVRGHNPNVYVIKPKLVFSEGTTKLPHVYSTDKQWLCLYYRKGREWNSGILIANTIIPWACEWLCHYELWVCTGTWHGGGIHYEPELRNKSKNKKNP